MTISAVGTMVAALDYISTVNGDNIRCGDIDLEWYIYNTTSQSDTPCWLPVVTCNQLNHEIFQELVNISKSHPYPPALLIESKWNTRGKEYDSPVKVGDTTWVVSTGSSPNHCNHFRMSLKGVTGSGPTSVGNVTLSTIDLTTLPPDTLDDNYETDQVYLRSLVEETQKINPVVGTSGRMPLTRSDDNGVHVRMCMGGECPIGNLFSDAFRWISGADIAFLSSGGFRGPGWPEGEVMVSNLWAAIPFTDHICTGVMSGVSLFRLLNYSVALANFESTYTENGDRLLQVSGMQYTYNTELERGGGGRLISVDTWDKEGGAFRPLDRLSMYKFATSSWMCEGFHPFPALLGEELRIEGEVTGTINDRYYAQEAVGNYLSQLGSPYNTSIQGRLHNDTDTLDPIYNFIQNPDGCSPDSYWEKRILGCSPCPGVSHISFSDDLVELEASDGDVVSSRVVLSNRDLFNITVAVRSIPSWVNFDEDDVGLLKATTILQPGESVVVDFSIDASGLERGTTRSTVYLGVFLEGSYRNCLTNRDITFDVSVRVIPEAEFNWISTPIRAVGLTLMVVVISTSMGFGLWTYLLRKNKVVRASQPMFLYIICAGTIVLALAILPLSIDDRIASFRACNATCMSLPWLLSVGFSVTFSALFSKTWRIHKGE